MHYKTGEIVSQIRILPTCVHDTAIIHNRWRPVSILVKSQTTQRTIFRIIQAHITYLIITIHTRYTVITDIGYSDKLAGRQISGIKEFQVFFRGFYELLQTGTIQFHFKYLPAAVGIYHREHQAFSIPM